MIQVLDRLFRRYSAPTSRIDERMERFKAGSETRDRKYWESSEYWRLEYERAHKLGLSYYGLRDEAISGKAMLEIGCGVGGALCAFRDRGASAAFGLEIDRRRLWFSREYVGNRTRTVFLAADGSQLPFKEESFDLLLTNSTFEHFHDPSGVLKEISRVLRTGGVLATEFCTPYASHWHHNTWEIRIPWVDRLFGEDTVMEYLRWKWGGFPAKSLREFRMLNGLSLSEFRRVARSAGLKEIACYVVSARHVLWQLPLNWFPGLRRVKFRGVPLGARKVPLCLYFPFLLPFPGHSRVFPGHYQGAWQKL